jgi:hypothetical protein
MIRGGPPTPTAAERLAKLRAAFPDGTQLAQALALAVRAEPELVRQIRLILFPHSSGWLEADLYFSSLVAQRTPDWILLDTQLVLELQEGLAQLMRSGSSERGVVSQVRRAVQQAHASAPFEIALEEEVIWLAVERRGGANRARGTIDIKLRSVLARMFERTEESIAMARWFASAARRMPVLARETQAFSLLAFAASIILRGRKIEGSSNASLETFEELTRYVPDWVERTTVWTALTTRGLHVAPVSVLRYEAIEVPRTNPMLLEVRAEDTEPVLVQMMPGEAAFVPVAGGTVTVRTLLRELVRFRPRQVRREQAALSESPQVAFRNDVYVSYAHIDYEWVEHFVFGASED